MSKKSAKAKSPKEMPLYEIKDIVLGKLRGYPPWPGIVVDPDSVPPKVQKERPAGKKTPFYCVQFFPAGDFSWLVSKDISKLQKHEIEAYVNDPSKRSPDLLAGYRIALDPGSWEEERKRIAEQAANAEQEESSSEDQDQDQLASESDGSGTSKKRKRAGSKRGTGTKRGRPSAGKKSKATVESEDDGEGEEDEEVQSKPPTKKAKTTNPKTTSSKSAANANATKSKGSKDKSGGDEEGEEEPADPEAVKVRDWRHKLQKTFLSSNKPDIKAEDMPAMDDLFTQIEQYDRMTIACLSFSKIGKVMRHIASLKDNKIPTASETQYRFRERARGLMEKWHVILNDPSSAANAGSNAVAASTAAAVNSSLNNAPNGNGAFNEMGMGVDLGGMNGNMSLADMSAMTLPDVSMTEAHPVVM